MRVVHATTEMPEGYLAAEVVRPHLGVVVRFMPADESERPAPQTEGSRL